MGWRQPPDSLSDSDEPKDARTLSERAETRKSNITARCLFICIHLLIVGISFRGVRRRRGGGLPLESRLFSVSWVYSGVEMIVSCI